MDEGRNGECVPLEECTCSHRGKTFMPGAVLQRHSKRWYVSEKEKHQFYISFLQIANVKMERGFAMINQVHHEHVQWWV